MQTTTPIQHQHTPDGGAFVIYHQQHIIAELHYQWQDNTQQHLSITHTWVDDSLRGQGVAKKLFDQVIHFARIKNAKVTPICTYAVALFQRDASLHDVLATSPST